MGIRQKFNEKVVEPLLDRLNIPHELKTSWFLPENTAEMPHKDLAHNHFSMTDGELRRVRLEAYPKLTALAKGKDEWYVRAVGEFEDTLSKVRRKIEHDVAMDQSDPQMFKTGPYLARAASKEEAMQLLDEFEENGLKSLMDKMETKEPSRFIDDFYSKASTASNVIKEHARERVQPAAPAAGSA